MKSGWQKTVGWLCVFTSLSFGSGCATIINSERNANINFTTDPMEARVSNFDDSCLTPCTMHLNKVQDNNQFTVRKKGYLTETYEINRKIHWSFWLNIIFGGAGILTAGIDFITGDMWIPTETEVDLIMEKSSDKDAQIVEGENLPSRKEVSEEVSVEGEEQRFMSESSAENQSDELIGDKSNRGDESSKNTPIFQEERSRIEDLFPKKYVQKQIEYYFGRISQSQMMRAIDGIYDQLVTLKMEGSRLDIDEAIRRYRLILRK